MRIGMEIANPFHFRSKIFLFYSVLRCDYIHEMVCGIVFYNEYKRLVLGLFFKQIKLVLLPHFVPLAYLSQKYESITLQIILPKYSRIIK